MGFVSLFLAGIHAFVYVSIASNLGWVEGFPFYRNDYKVKIVKFEKNEA